MFESHKVLCLGLFNGFNSLQIYPNIYTYPTIYKQLHGVEKYIYRLKEHGIFHKKMDQWYGAWKEKIKDVDTVMLSDGIRGRDLIQFIHKENPSARIIVYYLNSNFSHGRNEPSKYKDLPCELVTFDKRMQKIIKLGLNIIIIHIWKKECLLLTILITMHINKIFFYW